MGDEIVPMPMQFEKVTAFVMAKTVSGEVLERRKHFVSKNFRSASTGLHSVVAIWWEVERY